MTVSFDTLPSELVSTVPAELTITGMTCAACVRRIEKAVRAVPGVSIASDAILVARDGQTACAPAYFIDGAALGDNAHATAAAIPLSRIFGVEFYSREVPSVFADSRGCGAIVIWTKP